MSNAIVPVVPKRNAVTGAGYPTSLALGELAVNTTTGDVYLGADPGVVQIGVALAAGTYLNLGVGTGTDTQFEFAGGSGNAAGGYLVSVGGIDQPSGWTIDSGVLTFSEPPPAGAEVSIRAILKGISGGGGGGIGGRAWSADATYTQGDLVATSQRETWICIQNGNIGNDPVSSPEWWAPQPADAVSLQLKAVSTTAPIDGQVLMWSAANNQWEPTSLSGSVTFNTEGTHHWTAPTWVKSVSITANAGTGSNGTNGQDGETGQTGTPSSGGAPDGDPFVPATTGANGADGEDGVDGQTGRGLVISGNDISTIILAGGAAGQKGLGGYGGGGGGGAGQAYYCSGAANGASGSGPMGGSGGSAGASGPGGSSGGSGGAGGFDGQRWSGNGGNGGGGCAFENGAGGAGGAGTTGTTGTTGETYENSISVTPANVYEIVIGSGAGTASCTITW